jgi:hypothetical protein
MPKNRRIARLTPIFALLAFSCCSASSIREVDADRPTVVQTCDDEWNRRLSLLTEPVKKQFEIDKVVVDGTKGNGYFLISPDAIPDCRDRIEIGEVLYREYEDISLPEDAEYQRQHSAQLGSALRAIWNSRTLGADKYILLTLPALKDEDVRQIIIDDLRKNGYRSNLLYVTIERPLASPVAELTELLKTYKSPRDNSKMVGLLIALGLATKDETYLRRLRSIARSEKLSSDVQQNLHNLIRKLESGQKISFSDVESLGIPIED